MTSHADFRSRNRDQQDGIERHIWDDIEYISDAGAVLKVKGTGTEDEEAILLNQGYGFNPGKGYNTEVLVMAGASDTNQKYGMPQIPHNKQRKWKENTGGIQDPLDPDRAIEFNPDMVHFIAEVLALHKSGVLEIQNGQVLIRGNLLVSGTIETGGPVAFGGPATAPGHLLGSGSPNIPAFEPYSG